MATYDGMHTAGGTEVPPATSPAFAGLVHRSRCTHSRGVRLMDDAAPAVLTLGLSGLRARARETILAMFRSHTPHPRSAGAPLNDTPASHFGGRPPFTHDL